jgi:hypothetical protein
VEVTPLTWHLIVTAKDERAGQRVLHRVCATVGDTVGDRVIERYRKVPGQFSIVFTTALEATTPAGAVFQALTDAQRLGSGWMVAGPNDHGEGRWSFEMICAVNANGRFLVPGITWAHVEITPAGQPDETAASGP